MVSTCVAVHVWVSPLLYVRCCPPHHGLTLPALHTCIAAVAGVLLAGNNIGAAGVEALAPSLAQLTQLQTLDLGRECMCGRACVTHPLLHVRCFPHTMGSLCLLFTHALLLGLGCCLQGTTLAMLEWRPWRPRWPS